MLYRKPPIVIIKLMTSFILMTSSMLDFVTRKTCFVLLDQICSAFLTGGTSINSSSKKPPNPRHGCGFMILMQHRTNQKPSHSCSSHFLSESTTSTRKHFQSRNLGGGYTERNSNAAGCTKFIVAPIRYSVSQELPSKKCDVRPVLKFGLFLF